MYQMSKLFCLYLCILILNWVPRFMNFYQKTFQIILSTNFLLLSKVLLLILASLVTFAYRQLIIFSEEDLRKMEQSLQDEWFAINLFKVDNFSIALVNHKANINFRYILSLILLSSDKIYLVN